MITDISPPATEAVSDPFSTGFWRLCIVKTKQISSVENVLPHTNVHGSTPTQISELTQFKYQRKWAHKTKIRQESWHIKKTEKSLTIYTRVRMLFVYF